MEYIFLQDIPSYIFDRVLNTPVVIVRSTLLRCSINKKLFLNFRNIHRKTPVWSLVFKKRLQHRCSPVNIAQFLGAPILKIIAKGYFCIAIVINPFHATGIFLYPLKTSGNQRFSGVMKRDQWHEMG